MPERLRSSDLILIFSALVIAYSIWLVAKMSNIEQELLLGVPITIDLPSYIEADTSPHKSVSITVRYPKGQRKEIHGGAFELVIDDLDLVSQAGITEPQAVTVPLLPEDVRYPTLPQSIQVQKVDPTRLTVWVKYRTAPARVVPIFQGEPVKGYYVDRTNVTEEKRLLTGAEEDLAQLMRNEEAVVELETRPISLASKRDSFSTSVAVVMPPGLQLLNPETKGRIASEKALAVVQVIIKEEETTRTIRGVPVTVPTLTRNLVARTEPASGSVTIAGPSSRVRKMEKNLLQIRPKNPPEESSDFMGEVAIEARKTEGAPADVRIVRVEPEAVLLRYETRAEDAKTSPTP